MTPRRTTGGLSSGDRRWTCPPKATAVSWPAPEDHFQLSVYPNPFTSELTLEYELPVTGEVILQIIDLQGRVVHELWEGRLAAGAQRSTFIVDDNGSLANGIYFLRISQLNMSTTRRVLLYR